MNPRESLLVILLLFVTSSSLQAKESPGIESSAFDIALGTLQNQINYKFERVDLLRRAMTHSSYSEENNKALSVLGEKVIETSVSLSSIVQDIDITAKDLNKKISEISKVEASCAFDGSQLGLQKVVRVSRKTNSSTPAVVCGTFRAIFGAIAIDKGNSDDAGSVFWYVHGGGKEELWQCKLLIDAIDICMLLVLVNMHFPLRVVKVPRRQLEHPDDLLV